MSSRSTKGKNKAQATPRTSLANAFAQYQATSPNIGQQVARARQEVNMGFRPTRNTSYATRSRSTSIKQEVVDDEEWEDVDQGFDEDEGEETEQESGLSKARQKSIKAIVWIRGGCEGLEKVKLPDIGACKLLAQDLLARVATKPGEIVLDSEGSHDDILAAIASYLPHPLQHFQSLQSSRSTSVVIPIKVERSKLIPKHGEGLSGDEVFARFPKNRGWKERTIFLTGSSAIPHDVVQSWKGQTANTPGPSTAISVPSSPPSVSQALAPSTSKRPRSESAGPIAVRATRSVAKRIKTEQDDAELGWDEPSQPTTSNHHAPASPDSDIVMYEPARHSPGPTQASSSSNRLPHGRFQLSPTTTRTLSAPNPFLRKAT